MAKAQNHDVFWPWTVGSMMRNRFMRWRESFSQTDSAALYWNSVWILFFLLRITVRTLRKCLAMRDMLITLVAWPINLGFCDSQETCSEIFKVVGVLLRSGLTQKCFWELVVPIVALIAIDVALARCSENGKQGCKGRVVHYPDGICPAEIPLRKRLGVSSARICNRAVSCFGELTKSRGRNESRRWVHPARWEIWQGTVTYMFCIPSQIINSMLAWREICQHGCTRIIKDASLQRKDGYRASLSIGRAVWMKVMPPNATNI